MKATVRWEGLALPPVEPRLQRRYQKLVKEQLQISQSVAAGLKALPGAARSFASTQGAWRFYQNASVSLSALAQPLLAQARVSLARQKRKGQKPRSLAARPVSLRLIVSEVRAANGRVLATWLLLSNVAGSVNAATLALWYYWRWWIESFLKLLKSAGHQVGHWQQETALAVAKRLLVVSMACVLVWQLARAEGPAAAELRTVSVRLSRRQMKRAVPWTAPALLAGLWVLLAMLDLLEHYKLSKLQELAGLFFKPGTEKGAQDV